MWPKVILVVMGGFLLFGRSFAYLGIPPAKLFVGELVLGSFILTRPRDVINRWLESALRSSALSGFSIALALFLSYGVFEFARGIAAEYPAMTALQSLVFHCYPLYIFLGVWAGMRRPNLLWRGIRGIAWLHAIYGTLYVTVLSGRWLPIPGTDVNVWGQPNGAVVAILGLMCLPSRGPRDWAALALNVLVLIGLQVRADWLAVLVALATWGMLRRKFGSVAFGGVALIAALGIGAMTEITIPGPVDRGGAVTAQKLMARVVAPANVEMARELDPYADTYKGTAMWRTQWWEAIWATVHNDATTTFIGLGYGYPLGNLVPYLRNAAIRTPHNVFFYALGYGGWFGVMIFFWLQAQILYLHWRVFRVTGGILGLLACTAALTAACFGNLFETPFGAIPLYLLVGLTAAPLVRLDQERRENPAVAQLLPAARW